MPDTRPATFDHLQKKRPLEAVCHVYLTDDTVAAHRDAVAELDQARSTGVDVEAAEENVAKARAALEADTVTLRFRSIGRKNYDRLVADHPPTDKQVEEHQAQFGQPAPYNADTFPPALIAASCIEPKLTLTEVEQLFDEWNAAELTELFATAVAVNVHRRVVDAGKGS